MVHTVDLAPTVGNDIAPDGIELVRAVGHFATKALDVVRIGTAIRVEKAIARTIDTNEIIEFVVAAQTSDECVNLILISDVGAYRKIITQVAADRIGTSFASECLCATIETDTFC